MARERQTLDRRPGPLPEIRTDAENITFVFAPTRVPDHARLVIRCDRHGELWISIARAIEQVTGRSSLYIPSNGTQTLSEFARRPVTLRRGAERAEASPSGRCGLNCRS